jgi:hypothetical protein
VLERAAWIELMFIETMDCLAVSRLAGGTGMDL